MFEANKSEVSTQNYPKLAHKTWFQLKTGDDQEMI
jgi:hypothetical protein